MDEMIKLADCQKKQFPESAESLEPLTELKEDFFRQMFKGKLVMIIHSTETNGT